MSFFSFIVKLILYLFILGTILNILPHAIRGITALVIIGTTIYWLYLKKKKAKIQKIQRDIEYQKQQEKEGLIETELKKKLNNMIMKGKIEREELKPLIQQLPHLSCGLNDIDLDLDDYIEKHLKELSRREKIQKQQEEDSILAKSYLFRKSNTQFKQKILIVDDLYNLSPLEFERWVKKNVFEKEEWQVSETKITGDGGIDLVLLKSDEKSIAQCKRYRKTVGEPLLRDFYGAMMSEGVSRGFFITTGLFSLSALKFSKNKPIEMIDRRILAQKYI